MGKYNNKIMAEFNPPRKWVLGRDLSYTTNEINEEEIKVLKRCLLYTSPSPRDH